ncbi:protein RRNAD1 isoform X2 [Phalaenopsis equestris]|uniref:protein RRNAD1 isoform X2 n=1 Tax=Phalaenopsis equestris TaxID=78828 RepID=UPI0009E253C4|nr:protein RRNAD1 isoform X2 [Phalaenopsis equestris]
MADTPRRYSCDTAAETLNWMNAIADFLLRFRSLIDAHVVNFFKDRLWETIDNQWMECLRKEPVENLLGIPSAFVQEHWPPSLRVFIVTLRSLVLPREQNLSNAMLENFRAASIGSVLSQGMNSKKRHEVEILAAAVNTVAHCVNSQKGYLAQVLSFEYQLSVVAIDSSLHHSSVTSARANRIRKHYAAKLHELQHGDGLVKIPQTVTCQVLSGEFLAALSIGTSECQKQANDIRCSVQTSSLRSSESDVCKAAILSKNGNTGFLVLAGLHACGDLSVNMLRAFVDCEQVKALICVGCCYNLLSEENSEKASLLSGFPLSNGAKLSGLTLGKNARDLACQSAERWKHLTESAARQNFELHAFRAAFQMVLDKYYPEVIGSSPSIGRPGKALRRQQMRRAVQSQFGAETNISSFKLKDENNAGNKSFAMQSDETDATEEHCDCRTLKVNIINNPEVFSERPCCEGYKEAQSSTSSDRYALFKVFSKSGLHRLGLESLQDFNLLEPWMRAEPFLDFIGPYWSLRAAFGPLLETYILLDRLLFLQEHSNFVEAQLVPLFDPALSPRNMAIVARKIDANVVIT